MTDGCHDHHARVCQTSCCLSFLVFLFMPLLLQLFVFALLVFLMPASTFVLSYLQIRSLWFATPSLIANWIDPNQYNYWDRKCYPQYLLVQRGHFIKPRIFCKIVDYWDSKGFLYLKLYIFQARLFYEFYGLVVWSANCRVQQMPQYILLVKLIDLVIMDPQL